MHRLTVLPGTIFGLLFVVGFNHANGQDSDKQILAEYRAAALKGGDPVQGKAVFESKDAACTKCHIVSGRERRAGPPLSVVGDKYSREQLVKEVLEPSARLHPDYGTVVIVTNDGKSISGVLQNRTKQEVRLLNNEGKPISIPVSEIDSENTSRTSLMPVGLYKNVKANQFADLIAYLTALRQSDGGSSHAGLPAEIPSIDEPVKLIPFHSKDMKFDFPVWIIAKPGTKNEFMVVEQKARKIWSLRKNAKGDRKELFADLSNEASTGQFEGVMCLAFHPQFLQNRKYYLNYHVRNQGSHFSPIIAERRVSSDLSRDAGGKSRRLLQIPQDTDLHWGGMLAFGPDGYLYIGAGDAGPQEDPEGHGQNLGLLTGAILRIDVDHESQGRPYSIPKDNPYRNVGKNIRPEIWASGFRMPWRFSFDPVTDDLWVGEIGQNLFEEVTIARLGENHGWNVYEAFMKFSDRYRRVGEQYTPPVFSYRRRHGVSVTAGYVYRGKKNSSFYGAFIFGDFESKRLWALKQKDRKLVKVRQIGSSPEKISSFGIDADGELFVVGYEGTIFRLDLGDSVFE